MNLAVAGPIFTAAGVIIAAIVAGAFNRYRSKSAGTLDTAQAAAVIQGAALEMLEPLRVRIKRLEALTAQLEDRIHALTIELDAERDARAKAEEERDHLRLLLGSD